MNQITITIVFFGALKPLFGSQRTINITSGTNIYKIFEMLKKENPISNDILESCQIAIDSELGSMENIILKDCELAILPPFSGG